MNIELSTGVSMHVREHGAGQPIYLLIHGWAVSGAIWDPVLSAWPEGSGRLLVPDLRGTGFSSKPRDGYSLDAYASDVIALIDHLALSDFVLVGHSMGGTIVQRVALEREERLRSLVLVSPVPASGVPLPDEDQAYFRSLGGTREGAEQVLSMVMARKPSDEDFERMVRDAATVVVEAFLGGFDAWRTADFADRLGELQVSTLVTSGTAEAPLTPEVLDAAVVRPIANARYQRIEGSGHYSQYEATEALVAILQSAAG